MTNQHKIWLLVALGLLVAGLAGTLSERRDYRPAGKEQIRQITPTRQVVPDKKREGTAYFQ